MRKLLHKLRKKWGREKFLHNPWGGTPGKFWNDISWWNGYYDDIMDNPERQMSKKVTVNRDIRHLMRILLVLDELPQDPEKNRIFLDIGCGISLFPRILEYWGFNVTAIDFCQKAIDISEKHKITEEELAKCITIWESCGENYYRHVEDPVKSLSELQKYKMDSGMLEYRCCDWNDPSLSSNYFDMVYCKNGFRLSIKPYWRSSLKRLHEILHPGGIVIIETLNAIAIRSEVFEMIEEIGFTLWFPENQSKECVEIMKILQDRKYCYCFWPTG